MIPCSKSRNYVLHTLEKVAPSAYESCIYELVDNQVSYCASLTMDYTKHTYIYFAAW